MRLIYLGLVLDVLIPLLLLGIGFLLRKSAFAGTQVLSLKLIGLVLLAVSISELGATYFFKRKMLSKFLSGRFRVRTVEIPFEKGALIFAIVIYALCLTPAIYGFVYFLLGGSLSWFILFMALTFAGFLLFKPKEEELKTFFREEITPV